MPGVFYELEESLKHFLSEDQTDGYNTFKANFYKYNNLRIYMDFKKNKKPHFIIRIGISEAMFSLEDGNKMIGSLGSDDRSVKKWIERNLYKINESDLWNKSQRIKPATPLEDSEEYLS